ncbi:MULTISPECIES: phosphatase PAP2 family protein [Streptomyces]|uniref:Phosphatidic acid phosphatase type 2/haloperoxidase domain-containing protein n=1 Tax=Streptomyces luteosporeus TaxID=173856 RepID=A0ABN3U7T5_9ACTN
MTSVQRRAAAVTGLVALAAFAVLAALVVVRGGAPWPVDTWVLGWAVEHRPGPAVTFARRLTDTGTGAVPYLLAVLAGLLAGRTARQRLLYAAWCLLFLGAGQGLRRAVLYAVERARPPARDWATHASDWSFPSGHATTAALTAALLVAVALLRAPRARWPLAVLAGCWGAAVGLTRAYLGVHWISDVVGGWLFAVAWCGAGVWAAARWLPVPARPQRRRPAGSRRGAARAGSR